MAIQTIQHPFGQALESFNVNVAPSVGQSGHYSLSPAARIALLTNATDGTAYARLNVPYTQTIYTSNAAWTGWVLDGVNWKIDSGDLTHFSVGVGSAVLEIPQFPGPEWYLVRITAKGNTGTIKARLDGYDGKTVTVDWGASTKEYVDILKGNIGSLSIIASAAADTAIESIIVERFPGDGISNGSFTDNDYFWVLGAGWSVAGGKAVKAAGSASPLLQVFNMIPDHPMVLVFTISDYSAGTLTVTGGGYSFGPYSADGTVRVPFRTKPITGGFVNGIGFYADATFAGKIDNVSLNHWWAHPPLIGSGQGDCCDVRIASGQTIDLSYGGRMDIHSVSLWLESAGGNGVSLKGGMARMIG